MKYNNIYRCLIIALIVLQVNFFDFYNFPDWFFYNINSYSVKYLSVFIVLFACFIGFLEFNVNSKNSRQGLSLKFGFLIPVILLIIFTVFVTVKSSGIYRQTFFSTLGLSYFYFLILGYFAFHNFFSKFENIVWFFKIIVYSSFILSISKIIQSYLAGSYGIIVFGSYSTVDKNNLMSMSTDIPGFIRLPSASDFIFFGSFLLILTVLNKDIKIAHKYIILAVNIFFLSIVSQTRTYILIIAIFIFSVLLIKIMKNNKKMSIFIIFFGALAGIILVYYLFERLGFISDSNRSSSYTVRMDAIQYYLSQFNLNDIFAIGFASDKQFILLNHGYSLFYGKSVYYMDDVGVFGYLAVFGKLGVVWLVTFIVCLIKQIIYAKNRVMVVFLSGAIIATSGTLILLNVQRFFYFVFLLLLIDFFVQDDEMKKGKKNINYENYQKLYI